MPELIVLITVAEEGKYDVHKYTLKVWPNELPRGSMIDTRGRRKRKWKRRKK